MIGDAPLILLLIIEFIAVVFLALGYLIKYRKMTNLIAGFDRKTCADPEGLIAWIGNSLLALAIAAAGIFFCSCSFQSMHSIYFSSIQQGLCRLWL
jgi:hypothetical protein